MADSKLSCIIVDDEQKSRDSLKALIEEFCENAIVVATCQNVDEAMQAVTEFTPDVAFLDIQMKGETGFDFLEKLKNVPFEVIFTTAYSEYAIKAFRFSAIDYLLKPIDINDLRRSLAKVEKKLSGPIVQRLQEMLKNIRGPITQDHKIALPTHDGLIFIKLSEIVYCEASSNYTQIFTADKKKHIVSRTLKEYDDLLSEYNFFRIHNSYLVNLNAIRKYVRGDGGYVVMSNDVSLDVAKRRKDAFLSKLANNAPV